MQVRQIAFATTETAKTKYGSGPAIETVAMWKNLQFPYDCPPKPWSRIIFNPYASFEGFSVLFIVFWPRYFEHFL
jgi:hypothetical protein